jgi:hypothetical protein
VVTAKRSTSRSSRPNIAAPRYSPYPEYNHKRPRRTADWEDESSHDGEDAPKEEPRLKSERTIDFSVSDTEYDEELNFDLSYPKDRTSFSRKDEHKVMSGEKDKTALYDAYNQLHMLAQVRYDCLYNVWTNESSSHVLYLLYSGV